MIRKVYWSSCKVADILVKFYETCILSTDFRKHSNIKSNENPYSGSRFVSRGESDRQTWRS